ncbi:putative leucine-rich repeat-containing protein DDB_G0290503 [Nasonia vitripennis]|uniref:ZAD domain-containing protein n=1 Tax=Nasonia vitripennis TaxID=7425 RepID=A0A7M7HDW2_NASVI|nr:putative leucine-rich repeat-containing protein DDB_G0290503 [Nasonia vitripennis]
METLEKSRNCRLCGKNSGIAVDIFDKNESHVRKINAILPILVHEMDLLPKQMCHRCSYKLEEFYKFYVECAKTDTELKSQLSWMRKENLEEKIVTPMVKVNRFKIKTEPPDHDPNDPDSVFGKMNENSLVFPATILHSYDFDASPMLTCSRCRCICNGNINISKQSPKEVKELTKEVENQPHGSADIPDVLKKSDESLNEPSEPKSVNTNFNDKDIIQDNRLKEKSVQETPVINLTNCSSNKSTKVNGIKILKTENLNRALRPRKGSVDYIGQKKKDVASNLKTKLKSKLDMLSPSVITPANIKVTQANLIHPGPIIKLEKLDDAMKTLRVRKNLEEFNRRVKEYQRKKNQETVNDNHNRRNFRKDDIFSKQRTEDDDQMRRYLRREEKQRRKSLHKQENIFGKRICTDDSRRKSFQKDESLNQKSLEKNDNSNRKSLQRDEVKSNKNLQNENRTNLKKDTNENVTRVMELQIKQETSNKATPSNKLPGIETVQEKSCRVDISKEVIIENSEDRLTSDSVKLEKDYTCNVDYPRIKIKRHLPGSNYPVLEDSTLELNSTEHNEETTNQKSCSKATNNISPKHLRSDDRKLKRFKEKSKIGRVSKTKRKGMTIIKVKRKDFEKESSIGASQTDFIKYYCEECDTSFRNKELYKLHPCYQN